MRNPFAGVGRRALATLIDGIPLSAIFFFIVHQFGESDLFVSRSQENVTGNYFLNLGPQATLLLLLFAAFYYIGMELTFGGTSGKLMTGLRVRNADGSPLSIKGAVLRFLFRPIDGIFSYLLGSILIWSTSKNQRIGDIVGGTVVCYKEFVQPPPVAITYSDSNGWQAY